VLYLTRSLVLMAALSTAVVLSPSALANANRVVSSATGSGHITTAGELRTFSFSARRFADGTATGQVHVNSRSLDTIAHIEIDCLEVVGNLAHMSGVITRSSNPSEAQVGELRRLVVRDNGERAGDPPDEISTIPRNPNGETCVNSTLVPTRLVEHGNVQVRQHR
jgi:hypothetical protein